MLKRWTITIVLAIGISSCITYRNDYGRKRFNCCKFTIKPNKNNAVYKIIDTTKLYKIVSSEYLPDHTLNENLNISFLKFYANGKLGRFYSYDKDDLTSLNPKKADLGVYNYAKGKLRIQTYFYHVQGGGFVKNVLQKSTPNVLIFESEKVKTIYKSIEIPKEQLIYKPDW
ncbi:hypothetical protein [Spongiimicrobium salis]|uniref:hypothetical protein n=1 Tax=Spongiimicrobium salis TaxID=1667022 RepID=UPI00374DF250